MTLKQSRSFRLAIASLAIGVAVAGCNLQRDSQNQPPTEGVALNAPGTAENSGGESPAAGSEQPPAVTEAVEATSESDQLSSDIDEDLQELDNLNATADPLDDQP